VDSKDEEEASSKTLEGRTRDDARMGMVRGEKVVAEEEAYAFREVQVASGNGGRLPDLACVKVAYRMAVVGEEVEEVDRSNGPWELAQKQMV
jgi:hypothetical protein